MQFYRKYQFSRLCDTEEDKINTLFQPVDSKVESKQLKVVL